jgi:mediator of RNA polymerase II transcription subunit 31
MALSDQCIVDAVLPDDRNRLIVELEFIQSLSNPVYLTHLSMNNFLDDEAFINYLRYLRYFKQPEYMCLLKFPQSLRFLDALIDDEVFRKSLKLGYPFRDFMYKQQGLHWMHHEDTIIDKDKNIDVNLNV